MTLPGAASRKLPFSLDPEYNWITINFGADKFWIYFQPTKDGNSLTGIHFNIAGREGQCVHLQNFRENVRRAGKI